MSEPASESDNESDNTINQTIQCDEFFGGLAKAEVPLGRFGQPEEVAGLVAFLASYIACASIDVGGGMGKFL